MKKQILFIVLLALLFMFCTEDENNITPPEEETFRDVLGVWMWGASLYDQSAASVVERLADNHVRDVFLLVKGIAGTKTSADLLTDFITQAHAESIQVHLWYVVGKDDLFLANHTDAHVYHCPKPSLGYNAPYGMTDESVNLLYPGYQQYVLDNISYFLTNFDCDGIHLDYIRYSHFVYSWDAEHIQRADSLGCNTARLLDLFVNNYDYYAYNDGFIDLYCQGDSDVVAWVDMRRQVVYEYIEAIKGLIDEINPEIKLTAAFMPEGATDPCWANAQYSQDYALLSPLLDMIAPMAYFKDYYQSTAWVETVTTAALAKVDTSCKICTGVQGYNGVSGAELEKEISYAKSGGAKGIVIFRYGSLTEACWQVVDTLFAQWDE